jgi:hypothetical protein
MPVHVLTATHLTQGQRPGDFCYAVEGELVRLPSLECDDAARCGCQRAFEGLSSHRATTTARVVDRTDLDPDTYAELLADELCDAWGLDPDDPDLQGDLAYEAAELIGVAATLPRGAVIERVGAGRFLAVRGPMAA